MAKATGSKGNAAPKSAAKKQNGNGNKSAAPTAYAEIRKQLDRPLSECKPLPIGRNGAKVAPRRFHLLSDDIAKLRDEYQQTKQIPSPFNRGMYGYFFSALLKLGKDKSHSFKSVKETMRQLASAADTKDEKGKTDWQRFIGKESHSDNEDGGLDTDGKIKQNAYVLQRLGGMTPYALKLLQVGVQILKSKGCVIDILKSKDGKDTLYRLNTNSATPINETVRRRA